MSWRRRPAKPLQEQLIEARDNLRRQIAILEDPATVRGARQPFIDNRNSLLIARLQEELAEIEKQLGTN